MNESSRPLSIYLVAAEESGDALGAALAGALTAGATPVKFAGIGGRAMAAAGIASPFPIDALSIIGVSAIPRRLPTILRRIRESADAIVAARPDALVIIDSPDFTHRVARLVRARAPSIPILDYVSPSVWAWRSGRAHAMRDYVDCVLAILPFEPDVHRRLGGPPCVYVGHPLIERLSQLRPNADEAQRRRTDPPVVLVLPGSRAGEIHRLIERFGAAAAEVAARHGPIELILPTVPHLAADVRAAVASWAITPRVVVEPAEKWAAFRSARAALAASGTVTLELALAGVPTVAAYRVTLIEELIAHVLRLRARLTTIILANLVIGENVIPEFLQRDCTPQNLAAALTPLLNDTAERSRQIEAFARLDQIMAVETAPSAEAAATVLDVVRRREHRAATFES
ncbi:MAG: lipid-A-disaccharide synthase [Hyphomicrobiales bacterium]|nr:lipid-A-disaccharide synthase [Hyphomicrobiales bacterium]MDE2374852.1 lipid-A-disaccharide synthase [Hyphomicrobiales bacterium]